MKFTHAELVLIHEALAETFERHMCSECLDRARLLLVGKAERDAGTAYMVEGRVGVTGARRVVGRHLLRVLLRAMQDGDLAESPRAGLEADDGPDRGVHAYRVSVMDGLKQLLADGQLRLELGGAELKIDRFIDDRDGDDFHGDSSTSRGPESPPTRTTVEGAGRPGSPPRPDAPVRPGASSAVLDELAIIVQEALSLPSSDEPATAIATIRQASYTLWRILGTDKACARITHSNGRLIERYQSARANLEDGAS